MKIETLNMIKDMEILISTVTTSNLKAIRERIDELKTKVGEEIYRQLMNLLWKQARACEII